jgi:uncharacterized protein (DUF983 family)
MILLLDLCTNSGHNLCFVFVLTVIYFMCFSVINMYKQANQKLTWLHMLTLNEIYLILTCITKCKTHNYVS